MPLNCKIAIKLCVSLCWMKKQMRRIWTRTIQKEIKDDSGPRLQTVQYGLMVFGNSKGQHSFSKNFVFHYVLLWRERCNYTQLTSPTGDCYQQSCKWSCWAVSVVFSPKHVSSILLLEAQEQTREIFGSEREHLLWSQAKQGSAGLKMTECQSEWVPFLENSSQLSSWARPAAYRGWTHTRLNASSQLRHPRCFQVCVWWTDLTDRGFIQSYYLPVPPRGHCMSWVKQEQGFSENAEWA